MRVNGFLQTAQVETFTSATLPVASKYASRVVYTSDTQQLLISNGSVWLPGSQTSGLSSAQPAAATQYLYQFYFQTDTGYLQMCVPVSSTPTWVTVNGAPPAGSITTAMLGNNVVTAAKIANNTITRTQEAAVGQQISSSCGSFTTSIGGVWTAITNLSVTITTTGRPVILVSQGAPGISAGNGALFASGNTSQNATFLMGFFRGSTLISSSWCELSTNASNYAIFFPYNALAMDTPSAGTYTYTLQIYPISSSVPVAVTNLILAAYEL